MSAAPTCEWPARVGAAEKCGKQARRLMQDRPGEDVGWTRWCCGTHENRAKRIGWVAASPERAGREVSRDA